MMVVDGKKLEIKTGKEGVSTGKHKETNENYKKYEGRSLQEVTFSELMNFLNLTRIALILFLIALFVVAPIVQIFVLNDPNISESNKDFISRFFVVGPLLISILLVLIFFEIDILRWRGFSDWGALGAIIAAIGQIVIFLPVILYMFGEDNPFLYLVFAGGGLLITIIGYTSHATEIDRKIENLLFMMKQWLVTFNFRQFFKTLGQLILTTAVGIAKYLWQGIKELGTRIRRFFNWITKSIKFVLQSGWIFLTQTFPRTLNRSLIALWDNLHWIGLIAVIIYLVITPEFPIQVTDPILLKVELFIIIGFFFLLGVVYPYRERIARIATNTTNFVLIKTISAYSMLSGSKIKPTEAIFCSRCLRGVENREFESLKEIKGTMNPPCPFCGFNNWVGIERKPNFIDKLTQEEKLGVQDVQVVKVPKTTTKEPDSVTVSITDKKAIKKGKFPDYQSYQRAQDLGAQNFAELEFIDRLGAPDLETAEKIREGGFSHFQTFQKALAIGASSVSELRLVEELNAPDLVTAKEILKSKFPDYQSYQRAQNLGARTYSELQFIDSLGAPDLETAEKIRGGGFSNFQTFQEALAVGASSASDFRLVERFNAPDLETAKKIQRSGFLDFETYQKALAVGASSVSDFRLVERFNAPDLVTVKEIQKGKFPDYQSYKRAQDLGARDYSDLEYIDRLGAPDFETAEKIREGGFPDFETFQKALAVGASSVSELRLVEELNAPDLVTAKEIQKTNFPDYPSYQRAQDLGASNYSELKFIDNLQAPNYVTAKRMRRGKFPDYSSYKRAQDLGASNYSELEEVDHYQAPDFETVKKIRKGGFPNFQAFQKAQEVGASSFSEYISVEIPELADQKVKPSKPVAVLKEAKLDQEELEIINGLLTLGRHSSFVGKIEHLLKQLENRPTLSPKTINVVKNFRNHQDVVIRTRVKRILAEKKVTKTTQKVARRAAPSLVSEIDIVKFRKKVAELSQRIGASEKDVKEWHSWLLQQTDLYHKAQINEDIYETMLRRFKNHYLLHINTDKMQIDEMQALDAMRTLIDAILAGHTRLTMDMLQEQQISTHEPFMDDVGAQVDQETVAIGKEISELLEELLKVSQRLTESAKEFKEWYDWFVPQTNQYLKSQIDAKTYTTMLNRSQEFLLGIDSEKMQLDELRTYEEILTIVHAAIKSIQDQIREKDEESLALIDTTLDKMIKEQTGQKKKRVLHTNQERQGKLCPSCGTSIYPKKSKYCKECGTKL